MTHARRARHEVSDTCQINDLDHLLFDEFEAAVVSDTCQINDLDHDR